MKNKENQVELKMDIRAIEIMDSYAEIVEWYDI